MFKDVKDHCMDVMHMISHRENSNKNRFPNDSHYLSSQWWSIYVLWCVWVMNLLLNESNIKKGTIMKHPEWKGRLWIRTSLGVPTNVRTSMPVMLLAHMLAKPKSLIAWSQGTGSSWTWCFTRSPHLRHSRDLQQKSASGFRPAMHRDAWQIPASCRNPRATASLLGALQAYYHLPLVLMQHVNSTNAQSPVSSCPSSHQLSPPPQCPTWCSCQNPPGACLSPAT